MCKKTKKILGKTIKFGMVVCTILTGGILFCRLPFDKIKEKIRMAEKRLF